MGKVNKAIDPIRNFQHAVSKLFLVIRPNLDCGDLFEQRMESVQYQLSNKNRYKYSWLYFVPFI